MKRVAFGLTIALALACASCGNPSHLYPVSGKALYKGSPAAGAAVFFRRQGDNPMNENLIMGIVQQDGSFELVCGAQGKGAAPAGDYDVLIEWKQVTGHGKGRPQHGRDRLKGRYADPRKPRLHARVQAQRNDLVPFDLGD